MKKLLFVFTILLWHLSVFSQTFQKAIYKHANDINDERGISNRYNESEFYIKEDFKYRFKKKPKFDTTNSNVRSSISIEFIGHNNYIVRTNIRNSFTNNLFNNRFLLWTANESFIHPNFRFKYFLNFKKMDFSFGIGFDRIEFKNTSSVKSDIYRYNCMEFPLSFQYNFPAGKQNIIYFISFSPGIAINEVFIRNSETLGSYNDWTTLNSWYILSETGLIYSFRLSSLISAYALFSGKSTLTPFINKTTNSFDWFYYSTINFGLGLKYNLK
jgi:hypothetical protein